MKLTQKNKTESKQTVTFSCCFSVALWNYKVVSMDQQKLENEFLIFTKAQGLTRDHPFSIKLKTECIWASLHNFSNSLPLPRVHIHCLFSTNHITNKMRSASWQFSSLSHHWFVLLKFITYSRNICDVHRFSEFYSNSSLSNCWTWLLPGLT